METLDQQIKALKEQRAEKSKGLDAMADKAINEKRGLTADEQKSYDNIKGEIDSINSQLSVMKDRQKRSMDEAKKSNSYHPGMPSIDSEAAERNSIAKKYSIRAALTGITTNKPLDGAEREMSDHLRKEMIEDGCELMSNSTIVPPEAFSKGQRTVSLDALTATAAPNNEGSFTIQTDVQSIVDVLLPNSVLGKVPIMRMGNLRGNVQFPQAQTQPSASWASSENVAATQQSPKFAKLNLTPKRITAYVDMSNQLLRQSESNIQSFSNNYLVNAQAILYEKAFLKGGGSGEPTGIIGGTGYNTVYAGGAVGSQTNGAVMVWADWVNLVKAAQNANSHNGQAYITSPAQLGRAQITPRQSSGVEGHFILENWNAGVNGFPAYATTNMLDTYSSGTSANLSAIIFGDYTKSVAASWGGFEIGVDPYTGLKTSVTTLVLNSYVDCGMLNPTAFSVCKDLRP